ncbi:hypothetical protein P3T37_006786 [Kitasatospora sp. MAA4]|uniref:hypothetical protein n=1 Tax=Kitasatospora sp. MAA4 TaxID=3035093 RepID=UPI0024737CC6|nr:hypothetical protein [Kitasatospora sp. MAA4]MDH6137354.1 hypothetical protein [Kitasatospora sp. MAA4]
MAVNGTEMPAGAVQGFMALPERTEDGEQPFLRCLADVVRVLGLDVAPESDAGDRRTWEHRARAALREACHQGLIVSEASFDALMKAAVHDPNPSFNRQFVEPALNAFGHWRVQSALLDYLRTGADQERAGAARAWYWSALPLRLSQVRAESQGTESQAEPDDRSVVVREWYDTALREFVSNEDLDVRRCILPGLPLRQSAFPPELHDLVEAAVAIARSHPDEYIRHRVEHQVRD